MLRIKNIDFKESIKFSQVYSKSTVISSSLLALTKDKYNSFKKYEKDHDTFHSIFYSAKIAAISLLALYGIAKMHGEFTWPWDVKAISTNIDPQCHFTPLSEGLNLYDPYDFGKNDTTPIAKINSFSTILIDLNVNDKSLKPLSNTYHQKYISVSETRRLIIIRSLSDIDYYTSTTGAPDERQRLKSTYTKNTAYYSGKELDIVIYKLNDGTEVVASCPINKKTNLPNPTKIRLDEYAVISKP
jgi:hypothetical protein